MANPAARITLLAVAGVAGMGSEYEIRIPLRITPDLLTVFVTKILSLAAGRLYVAG